MATVLACGVAVLDVQQTVERLPAADEKLVAADLLVASGGPAANAAVTAVALGTRAVLLTRIGDSPLGRLIAADLAEHGVEVIDRGAADYRPAVSTVLVTRGTGQRAVVSVNATLADPTDPDPTNPDPTGWAAAVVADADAVLVDGHHLDLACAVARAARSAGIPVLLDGGSWKPGLERLLASVDVAVLSADFHLPTELSARAEPAAGTEPDEELAMVAAFGPRLVARSHGPQPVVLAGHSGTTAIPVPRVDVVDTLGAGDVLHGALAAWLAVRGSGDPAAGLAWAARVAADSCAAPGARGWLADPARVAEHRQALGV